MAGEEINEELNAYYAAEKQIEEEFLKAKQVFKEKGEYKGDFTEIQKELFDGCLYAQHIGYVNVELLPDIKNTVGRYSMTERFFKVSDDSTKEFTRPYFRTNNFCNGKRNWFIGRPN